MVKLYLKTTVTTNKHQEFTGNILQILKEHNYFIQIVP